MKKTILILSIFTISLFIFGCTTNLEQSMQDMINQYKGNEIVNTFYTAMETKNYDLLDPHYSEEFLEVSSKEETEQFYTSINNKLGNLIDYNITYVNFETMSTLGGTTKTTVLTISSSYEKGEATETLTIIEKNGIEKLHGWNINSKALILN
ncbi:MAG: hypothetical protein HON47_01095 [Candidatus Diapherotrites archaeon]|jgi:hypothetical protein|uniref:Uncharacterized protein n=1 Tax=Candidatus Iainarchaeum sp. TaxID=3101447 RepID=A0A8T5GE17_9ARCH|nr:hypothetical protein [Candidatus Diapherotrites archaeon]